MSSSVLSGPVRRIAILTVRNEPCACYLARKLRGCGAEIIFVSQRRLRVEPESWPFFVRLFRKRGVAIALDNIAILVLRRAVAVGIRVRNAVRTASDDGERPRDRRVLFPTEGEVLYEDPALPHEDWLTYFEVDDINRAPDQDRLRQLAPDLILLGGAPVLSRSTIGIARLACLNAHCGITPDYAGSGPFDWAIYERRFDQIGYTVHVAEPRVDSGAVLHQERVAWDPSRSNRHLWPVLAQAMYDRLAEIALGLVRGARFEARPQSPTRVMPPVGLFVRIVSELRRRGYARAMRSRASS